MIPFLKIPLLRYNLHVLNPPFLVYTFRIFKGYATIIRIQLLNIFITKDPSRLSAVKPHSHLLSLIWFWSPNICLFWIFHTDGMKIYKIFCIWLILHNFFRIHQIVSCIITFYCRIVFSVWISHVLFIHSPAELVDLYIVFSFANLNTTY